MVMWPTVDPACQPRVVTRSVCAIDSGSGSSSAAGGLAEATPRDKSSSSTACSSGSRS